MNKYPMTRTGFEQIRGELKRLKTKDRYAVAQEIETAREHGDLSENAEYDAAKEKQGILEARIRLQPPGVGRKRYRQVQTVPWSATAFEETRKSANRSEDRSEDPKQNDPPRNAKIIQSIK